jgi:hypothetical protein
MIDSVLIPPRSLRVKRPGEDKSLKKPRFTLQEYRRKHKTLLEELRFSGNAAEVGRRLGLSRVRVHQIARRAGLRFVRAIEWPSGKVIES